MDNPSDARREIGARGRRAVVRLDGQRVGELLEIDEAYTRFVYDAAWLNQPGAVPVSLTLPLRAEPYDSRAIHPFFENLLPEGWLLQLSTAKLKIPPDDAFGLLIATCADCVGAVEIVATDPGATADDRVAAGGEAGTREGAGASDPVAAGGDAGAREGARDG